MNASIRHSGSEPWEPKNMPLGSLPARNFALVTNSSPSRAGLLVLANGFEREIHPPLNTRYVLSKSGPTSSGQVTCTRILSESSKTVT